MMQRSGRRFTVDQINDIRKRVKTLRHVDEMALLVYLLLETKLKMNDLLTWFNTDKTKRMEFLKMHPECMADYARAPRLFPKTHQGYLKQWSRKCLEWYGVQRATFEMLKRSISFYTAS